MANNLQQQEKLQAVVLLDSYSNKFRPLSSTKAECLLPFVGGKTLLDNNVEFLLENNVEEIYLFCTRHHQQIEDYIKKSKWNNQVPIHFLYNLTCQSLGDAMREINAKNLFSGNFILITATSIVSNIKLKDHLELHKQTAKLDRNAIMTIMCMNQQNDILNHTNNEAFSNYPHISIVHNSSNKILNYEQKVSHGLNKKSKSIYTKIPKDIIKSAYKSANKQQQAVDTANAKLRSQNKIAYGVNATKGFQGESIEYLTHLKTIQQRNDLLETQIYLCSEYVMHLFTDNFDFQSMNDLIRGVLVDEEVSGQTIYIDILKKKFGFHFSLITNLNSYYYESMRLLQRTDLIFDYDRCANYNRMLDRINVYISKKSNKFGDNLKLNRNVMIDANCKIGENCQIVNCYLGDNCVIGNNVKISNSIIWSNCKIGNNCVINATLLGSNVRIGNNVHIVENTLFSNDCAVKDNTKFKFRAVYHTKKEPSTQKGHQNNNNLSVKDDNYIKFISTSIVDDNIDDENDDLEDEFGSTSMDVSHEANEEEDDDDNQSGTSESAGDTSKNNHFFVWKLKTDKKSKNLIGNKLLRQSDNDSENDYEEESSEYSSDSTSDSEEEYEKYDDNAEYSDDDDNTNQQSSSKKHAQASQDDDIFLQEVIELLVRGLKQNLDPDNVILEINSSKHANNIQIDDVCYLLARALLFLPIIYTNNLNKLPENDTTITFDYIHTIQAQLKKYDKLLVNYYTRSRQSQKMFLRSYQDFFIETKLKLKKNDNTVVSFIDSYYVLLLHRLYKEFDFLNEQEIIDWYDKQNYLPTDQDYELKTYAHKKLVTFIDWLKQPDSDDSDDEDDDE